MINLVKVGTGQKPVTSFSSIRKGFKAARQADLMKRKCCFGSRGLRDMSSISCPSGSYPSSYPSHPSFSPRCPLGLARKYLAAPTTGPHWVQSHRYPHNHTSASTLPQKGKYISTATIAFVATEQTDIKQPNLNQDNNRNTRTYQPT